MLYLDNFFPAVISGSSWSVCMRVWFIFLVVFLFFCCFFSPYARLTVSGVPFLFEHLFTYCVIGGDVKSASLILSHSLLGQFDSVFLKWGNSWCTTHLLYRISLIACVGETGCRAVVSPLFSLDLGCLCKIHAC